MSFAHAPFRLSLLFVVLVASIIALPQPADAATKSTCNGAVCEEVVYSGTTVTSWKTTVYPGSGYNCRTARFWVNGGVIYSKSVCGTGGLYAYANTPYTLPSGSQLCASWVDEWGYACVTI